MVFYIWTIGVNGFSMVFQNSTIGINGFSYSSLNLGTIKYAYHFRLLELKKW